MFLKRLFKPNVEKLSEKKDIKGLVDAMRDQRTVMDAKYALVRLSDEIDDETLTSLMEDDDPFIRYLSTDICGTIKSAHAVDLLIKILKDPSKKVRWISAANLGYTSNKKAIKPLIHALNDEEPDVRRFAVISLAKFETPQSIDVLIKATEDEDDEVREEAVYVFWNLKDEKAFPALVKALKDENSEVREKAVYALKILGDKRAIKPLVEKLKDKSGAVRRNARNVLMDLGWKPTTSAEKTWELLSNPEPRIMYKWEEMEKIGLQSVEPLLEVFNYLDLHRKSEASQFLSQFRSEDIVPLLVDALRKSGYRFDSHMVKLLVLNGDRRVAEDILSYIYVCQPRWPPRDLEHIFGDYTNLIIETIRDGQSSTDLWDGTWVVETHYSYDLSYSNMALQKLCDIYTPVADNLLHKMVNKSDKKVLLSKDLGYNYEYSTLSFKEQRQIAREELIKRGNPPYNPSIYLSDDKWKIKA